MQRHSINNQIEESQQKSPGIEWIVGEYTELLLTKREKDAKSSQISELNANISIVLLFKDKLPYRKNKGKREKRNLLKHYSID